MDQQDTNSPVLELVQAQAVGLHSLRQLVALLCLLVTMLHERAERRKHTADQNHMRWKQRLHDERAACGHERDELRREITGLDAALGRMTNRSEAAQQDALRVQGELRAAGQRLATLQQHNSALEERLMEQGRVAKRYAASLETQRELLTRAQRDLVDAQAKLREQAVLLQSKDDDLAAVRAALVVARQKKRWLG